MARLQRAIPRMPGQSNLVKFQQELSVTQAINYGSGVVGVTHLDTNGWPDTFTAGNITGVLVRVAAIGGTSPTNSVWTAANTKIAHNLGYVPSGYLVVYKDKVCDIKAGTTQPDTQYVYLTISDDTANTTLWIF